MDLETLSPTLTENQDTITDWGRQTFGEHPPMGMAARMNVEVAELMEKLAGSDPQLRRLVKEQIALAERISERHHWLQARGDERADEVEDVEGAAEECADVFIVLAQVASCLGGSLQVAVDQKMGVNRRRTWSRTPGGRHQHD